MNILVGLIPAFGWGFQPIISKKTGGKATNQLIGTCLACFIIGCFIFVTLALTLTKYNINYFVPLAFWCNFIKGVLWCCGATCIFIAISLLGVSKLGPLSTGVQLVYTTIMGIAMFHENYNDAVPYQGILICVVALIIVLVGMVFVSWKPKTTTTAGSKNKQLKANNAIGKKQILFICMLLGIIMIGNGSFFVFSNIPLHYYGGSFSADPKIYEAMFKGVIVGDNAWILPSGMDKNFCNNVYNLSAMFALGIGMISGAIIVSLVLWLFPMIRSKNKQSWDVVKKDCPFLQSQSYYSVLAGISFGIASLALLYSTNANGTVIASMLGQLNVVVLSVSGMFIFKEKKSKIEYITLFIGLGLVMIGCLLPSFNEYFFPLLKN